VPKIDIEKVRKEGIKIRVKRSGVYQQITFQLREETKGNIKFIELFTDKNIDLSEIIKIANEYDIPIRAKNGIAFPEGKDIMDFIV